MGKIEQLDSNFVNALHPDQLGSLYSEIEITSKIDVSTNINKSDPTAFSSLKTRKHYWSIASGYATGSKITPLC
jgi:hypothetical protein